jgi:hypothetical protein
MPSLYVAIEASRTAVFQRAYAIGRQGAYCDSWSRYMFHSIFVCQAQRTHTSVQIPMTSVYQRSLTPVTV